MNLTAFAPRLNRATSEWNRFWFTPTDPTVLAAIRIVVGIITFYTLLAYSFELQELVGEHAWLDLQLRQEQYRDSPVPYLSLDWTDPRFRAPLNDGEKQYFEAYLARWGSPPPLPYPKSAEEAVEYDVYRARWGADPRLLIGKGVPVWSIWFHVTDPVLMNGVHIGFIVCSFCLLIGFGTRLTAVLTWFGALSYIHRAPASLFGVDTMMTILLLYLMIGPSGATLSVDRWLAKWWARRRGLPAPELRPSTSATLTIRLIQIHVCIIYLSAGLAKLQGQGWWTGTAPWGTLANFEFAPMQNATYVAVLRWLAKTRWLFEITMTAGAVGTLAFEIGYPFLIWRPRFRALWLWLAVFLHAGIGMFMGLKTFSVLMLAFNMAFLTPESVRWALGKWLPKAWSAEAAIAEPPAGPPPQAPSHARHEPATAALAGKRRR